MAEIKVVRKSPLLWPWVAGIVIVVLAIAWINWNRGVSAAGEPALVAPAAVATDVNPAAAAPLPPLVASFVQFTESAGRAEMGASHEFVSRGITQLAMALDAVAPGEPREPALQQRLDAFHEQAKRLQANPESPAHANMVRDAFMSAAQVISSVQHSRLPDDAGARKAAGEIRAAASAMDPNAPLLDQGERVKAFFDRAADTLRLLAAAGRG